MLFRSKLLEEKRGTQKKFEHLGGGRVMIVYELPLNEIVLDFYDRDGVELVLGALEHVQPPGAFRMLVVVALLVVAAYLMRPG